MGCLQTLINIYNCKRHFYRSNFEISELTSRGQLCHQSFERVYLIKCNAIPKRKWSVIELSAWTIHLFTSHAISSTVSCFGSNLNKITETQRTLMPSKLSLIDLLWYWKKENSTTMVQFLQWIGKGVMYFTREQL